MIETANFDLDLSFLRKCFKVYLGRAWLIPVCCILLLTAGVCLEGYRRHVGKKDRNHLVYFLLLCVILGLTVYNPLATRLLVPRIFSKAIFYRIFWLMPAVPALAYVLVLAVARGRNKFLGGVILAAAFSASLILITQNTLLDHGFHRPENIYKVPQSVVYACDAIHEDFEEEERLPKTIWAFELEVYVRQYDPSILLSIPRDMRLNYAGSITVSKSTGSKRYKRRALILDVINSVRDDIKIKRFKNAMRMTKTDYLIIPEEYTCHEYLKEAGCQVVSSGEGVVIYRYIWEKKKNEAEK